ncbi:MAG: TetR family transcriptional regulator, partial [Pseudonocardiales bacterium]|nr:TetR family transcriptional regulator [Pseudonocardiales bacterium]
MTVETAARRGRGRRPAAEVREAVLAAAAAMLLDGGMRDITFEKVAARAGASKMTLYKWWPTPGALAFDAYFAATAPA